MKGLIATSSAVAVAAALGAGGTYLMELLPGDVNGFLAGALVCCIAFVFWPWAVLPVGIVGGVIATKVTGETDVATIVLVHTGILVAGCLALLARHLTSSAEDGPRRTIADGPMALLGAVVAVAALYGLARGNAAQSVLIATYHIGIIPAYFFAATHTLTNPHRLKAAGVLYIAAAGALAAVELTMPGRHGGLLSVLAIPMLLIAASRVRGWRQGGLISLIALFTTDVILASYRAMWLAFGLALLILLVRGTARVRRSALIGIGTGALFLATASVASAGLHRRAAVLAEYVDDSSGYRLSEMYVGLRVFSDRPLIGEGLGQTTPQVYLPDFMITDVGPTYHVFWVMILANLGLIGLVVVLWPLWRALRAGWVERDGHALAALALTCGFVASACLAGPTDGHWELGLLPAIILLAHQVWPCDDSSHLIGVRP
ncbi:O-antigen ligase family protein [Saccharopolyspora mangrovi]|uniref:O-antigen ligase family protein n=1 Tax=Saccharopolyspora mangrovi TaxID=3082379 RepID=A0ABU6AEP4_9PSEU|nr:O-antigen ligase family protein [Saccharopolyspora sp. S2-29]MEB3369995.1 O-antigen ligase family protein [Saccharopolyspora sp. S2-29]